MAANGRRPPYVFAHLWFWELYRCDAVGRGERPTGRGFVAVLADLAGVDGPRALPRHWLRTAREDSRRLITAHRGSGRGG